MQQNSFTPYDKYCPFYKTVWMLRNIVEFYDRSQRCVSRCALPAVITMCSLSLSPRTMADAPAEDRVTWAHITSEHGALLKRITQQKFQDPTDGEEALVAHFEQLNEEILAAFQ